MKDGFVILVHHILTFITIIMKLLEIINYEIIVSQCAISIITIEQVLLESLNLQETLAAVPHVDIAKQPGFSRHKFRGYIISLFMSLDLIKTRGSKF